MHYTLISTDSAAAALASTLSALSAQDLIAVDTEFIRVREYYPKLALLQICIPGDDIYLVDPLSCSLTEILPALLHTKAKILIFSGREDLEILYQYAQALKVDNFIPQRLCDLQLMAAFANHSYGRGLFTLVKDFCGVELNKEQTLSDWLARPLNEEQLRYAALDVAYLPAMYADLDALLDARRRRFFELQMREFAEDAAHEDDPLYCYRHVAAAGLLNERDLTVLQYICAKRLEFAREHDEALNRVITTRALCELARRKPATSEGLAACQVKWGSIREYGAQMLSWIAEAAKLPVRHDLPLPDEFFSHKRELQGQNNKIKGFVEHQLKEARMHPQLGGGRKAVYELYLARYEGRPGWLEQSWRRELLGPLDDLLDLTVIENERALRQQAQ